MVVEVVPADKVPEGLPADSTGGVVSAAATENVMVKSVVFGFRAASIQRTYLLKVVPFVSPVMVVLWDVPPVVEKVFVMLA